MTDVPGAQNPAPSHVSWPLQRSLSAQLAPSALNDWTQPVLVLHVAL